MLAPSLHYPTTFDVTLDEARGAYIAELYLSGRIDKAQAVRMQDFDYLFIRALYPPKPRTELMKIGDLHALEVQTEYERDKDRRQRMKAAMRIATGSCGWNPYPQFVTYRFG